MVEVQLAAVRVDLQSNTPVVLLQEMQGAKRTLPIFIGPPEATAIAFAIQGVPVKRPMTHDLMRDLLEVLDASVEQVVITELVATTYHAELRLVTGGRHLTVQSRPSDAIALAARTGTPLFVADDLLDSEGVVLASEGDEEETPNPEELLGEFQKFLDEVKPEDFSS
ncbi:MAG TPA: bifunctional nuclease family protein [Acidimicrobiales bacterium]|jgi:bifunctional DNase/RNase|nr:bifunctional nuclease family protein [Acidimicrobiales bacterium]